MPHIAANCSQILNKLQIIPEEATIQAATNDYIYLGNSSGDLDAYSKTFLRPFGEAQDIYLSNFFLQ